MTRLKMMTGGDARLRINSLLGQRGKVGRAIAFAFLMLLTSPVVAHEVIQLLDAGQLPADQGWSLMGEYSPGVTTDGTYLTADSRSSPVDVQWFHKPVPQTVQHGFSVKFDLKVDEVTSPHNLFDAGLIFYGSTVDPSSNFAGGPRDHFVYFDEDEIGWGDESDSYAMNTTDAFHSYELRVSSSGSAEFFADGVLALTKSNFKIQPRVGFGDMTNDPGLNSKFVISDITMTIVPEPSSLAVSSLAVLWLTATRRKLRDGSTIWK